jgi:hypothetical protein
MGSGLTLTALGADFLNPASISALGVERLFAGIRVDRAASGLPATTSTAMFTVTGTVLITQFLGQVGTVIQTQACNYSLESNPTAAGANVALCAVLNISAVVASAFFGLTGILADAMLSGLAIVGQTTPQIIQAGTIEAKTSATNTGTVAWSCWYIPLTTGATVVAA